MTARLMVFSNKEENFLFLLPVPFLFFALFESFTGLNIGTDDRIWWRFFSNVIFFNSIHIAFTFMLIASIPNFKIFFREKDKRQRIPSSVKILTILFLALLAQWSVSGATKGFTGVLALQLFIAIYAYHHAIKQNFGISNLYNRNLQKLTPQKNIELQKHMTTERIFFNFLVGLMTLSSANYLLGPAVAKSFFFKIAVWTCLAVYGVLAAWMILSAQKLDKSFLKLKYLFYIRILLYPLTLFSFTAFMGVTAVHGVEYAFVTKKILHKSNSRWADFINPASMSALVVVLVFALLSSNSGIVGLVRGAALPTDHFAKFVSIVLGGLSLLHYYLDGVIFRFKDPIAREHCSPLLS